MSIRSMMLISVLSAAVGCVDSGAVDSTGSTTQNTGGGGTPSLFTCDNDLSIQAVSCIGSISTVLNLPITVNVYDVRALNGNELNVLSGDLNNVKVLDANSIDQNKILNDVEVTTLNDFLNKFSITTTKNNIDVCVVAGICI